MSRKRKRWLLLGVSLLLCFFLAEAAVRFLALQSGSLGTLATGGVPIRQEYKSLEDFLQARAFLKPHQDYLNHWTNALGFHDREFEIPKPEGRFRVMALGDSFALGFVPYPATALTLVEQSLSETLPDDLDLLNLGINATGVWEYRQLFQLSHQRLDPDLVVVHFYMGNDGPDHLQGDNDIPLHSPGYRTHSLAWNLLANSYLAWSALRHPPPIPAPASTRASGGEIVTPGASVDAPRIESTVFPTHVCRPELTRLLKRPPDTLKAQWEPVLSQLRELHRLAQEADCAMVLILYPSRWQVDPDARTEMLKILAQRPEFSHFNETMFDPNLPQSILGPFCQEYGIPCYDLTPGFRTELDAHPEHALYREYDTHWNERGNALAAELEAGFLKEALEKNSRTDGRAQGRGSQILGPGEGVSARSP